MAAKGKAKLIEIYVWDIKTKEVISCLKGFHLRAVCQVAFSPDGKYLLSIGRDNDNSLAIYDWKKSRLVCTSKVDKSKVTCITWTSRNNFVTVGIKHIKFWTLNGRNIKAKKGRGRGIGAVVFAFDTTVVTGNNKGKI